MEENNKDEPNQSTRRKKRTTLNFTKHEDIKDNVKSTCRRKKRTNQINLQEEDHSQLKTHSTKINLIVHNSQKN